MAPFCGCSTWPCCARHASLAVVLYRRGGLTVLDWIDWLHPDLGLLHDTWVKIWTVGTQQAVDVADRLVNVGADLVTVASKTAMPAPASACTPR
jgi:hypothetical protein